MRVLICGSRNFLLEGPIARVIRSLPLGTIVIHGAAKGADTIAGRLAKHRGLEVVEFPAEWHRYGRAAGHIRNKQMLAEGQPDIVYAFYVNRIKSRGTANMVSQARNADLPVVEYGLTEQRVQVLPPELISGAGPPGASEGGE